MYIVNCGNCKASNYIDTRGIGISIKTETETICHSCNSYIGVVTKCNEPNHECKYMFVKFNKSVEDFCKTCKEIKCKKYKKIQKERNKKMMQSILSESVREKRNFENRTEAQIIRDYITQRYPKHFEKEFNKDVFSETEIIKITYNIVAVSEHDEYGKERVLFKKTFYFPLLKDVDISSVINEYYVPIFDDMYDFEIKEWQIVSKTSELMTKWENYKSELRIIEDDEYI